MGEIAGIELISILHYHHCIISKVQSQVAYIGMSKRYIMPYYGRSYCLMSIKSTTPNLNDIVLISWGLSLHGHVHCNFWVRLVTNKLKILILEFIDVLYLGSFDYKSREISGLPRQLFL